MRVARLKSRALSGLLALSAVFSVQANELTATPNAEIVNTADPILLIPASDVPTVSHSPINTESIPEAADTSRLETVPLQEENKLDQAELPPEQAWLQRLQAGLLRPQYQHLTQAIRGLDEKAQAFCAAPDENWLEQVREQWRVVLSRWASLSVAPMLTVWESVAPQLWTPLSPRALERYWDKNPLSPAMVSQAPATEKGLAAVEALLFAANRPAAEQVRLFADPQRCIALTALTGALVLDSAPLLNMLENQTIQTIPSENTPVSSRVLHQWQQTLTALRQWRQDYLLVPLQQRQSDRVLTPLARSDASLLALEAALDGIGTLWLGNGKTEGLRAWLVLQHPGLAQAITQQYDEVRASAQALMPSLDENLLQQPRKVQRLATELKRLENLLDQPLIQALGLKPVL